MKRYYENPNDQAYFEECARDYYEMNGGDSEYDSYDDWVDDNYDDIIEYMDEIQSEGDNYVAELLEDDPDFYEHW